MAIPILIVIAALAATLPLWLPRAVVALRVRIFTGINGEEGIAIPGKLVGAHQFKRVYSHPAANGRSRGAALSDLFWYWLSPGPDLHQEHLEPGPRYQEVASATRAFLAIAKKTAEDLAARCASRVLDERGFKRVELIRLRDLMMPIWAELYYQLVFGQPCPRFARDLIVANADDVVTALKMSSLRHMERRHRLTRYLVERLAEGELAGRLPAHLSLEQRALYLQGVFFNTAVVQMSEAMAHLLLALAQNQAAQATVQAALDDDRVLDLAIAESLRAYPLFGVAHRITSADIEVGETTLPKGSVLCFNYLEYQKSGVEDSGRFCPARWESQPARPTHYIPFGVAANRPCPAQTIALVTMRAAAREMLRRFELHSTAAHTRSLPNRGPCMLVARTDTPRVWMRETLLVFLGVRDRWEEVGRSLVQLVLGTYMVWDARRQRLCERYFEAEDLNQ